MMRRLEEGLKDLRAHLELIKKKGAEVDKALKGIDEAIRDLERMMGRK